MAHRGYLVIADVTGYTRFLTGSELEHAQGVLEDLFAVILERLKSPLALSNIQGDAFFAYADDGAALSSGQILDSIEALYFGFRARLKSILDNTTCKCRACSNAGELDLKFVVHHGAYMIQDIRGRRELTGPDVILVHRLLKNDVAERTGVSSYALMTEAAVEALDLRELSETARPYATDLEEFGRVDGAVIDLGERWKSHYAESAVIVADDELWTSPVTRVLRHGLASVWEAYWNPAMQSAWNANTQGISRVAGDPKRIRAGAVDHCAHGKQTLIFHYVDVRPLKHVTVDCAIPLNGRQRWTVAFSPADSGTRVTVRIGRPQGPNPVATVVLRAIGELMFKRSMRRDFTTELEMLDDFLNKQAGTGERADPAPASLSSAEIAAAARTLAAGAD